MLYDVKNDESMWKLAAVLQFTYPGAPMIYYGDELGTTKGEKETENRMGHDWEVINSYDKYMTGKSMEWDKVNRYNSYHGFYKHLIWLRKAHPALVSGDFIPVLAGADAVAFFRKGSGGSVFVIVNRGTDTGLKIKIPESILGTLPDLKCVYGGNGYFRPRAAEIDFYIGAKNAYIFAG